MLRFNEALWCAARAGAIPLIAEVKAHSAVRGDLLHGRSVEHIADSYQRSPACCLSVVTGKWFKGHVDLLRQVAAVVDKPILRKDFIISAREVDRSAELGASAVLLTRKLMTADHFQTLLDYTLQIGLTPFVEVADENEIRDLSLPAGALLAINNRDIGQRETDDGTIANSLALLDLAKRVALRVISASAIDSAEQARLLIERGFDGVLVGTSLLLAPNLQRALDDYRVVEPVL
ncbi:MAG: indole-3-glycerol-phosphate synthase [Gammaproteobacteria bacterium]|nr:indole-3-glycerol-phosphate synthase [Gammaproteobacteria bacterium]